MKAMVSFQLCISLLLALCSIAVNANVDIVDATTTFTKSTESIFDHQVTLISTESETLTFHWNDIEGNKVEGRLVHVADSMESAPSWLGFGVYDTYANNDPVTPTTPLMVGSDAVIGLVSTRSVLKYELNGKVVTDLGGDGVHPAEHQTLLNSGLLQHVGDDGTVTTDLSFEKLLEESNSDEVRIRHVGENVFLWALGPPDEEALGVHSQRGAFTLDLSKVQEVSTGTAGTTTTDTGTDGEGAEPSNEPPPQDDSGDDEEIHQTTNTASVVIGQCDSEYEETDMMVALTPKLNFHWRLNYDAQPQSMTAIVEFRGDAWLGLGFSPNGKMTGSTAVIGVPGSDDPPSISLLKDRTVSSIVPFASQTLQGAEFTQEDGKSILTFTKTLNEGAQGEVVLKAEELNTFIYAIGDDNNFGYHAHRGSFQLDLSSCSVHGASTGSSKMGVWVAHGVFAALAWAVASPFAITVAWFRTLVPSSWIYIHVFGHVTSYFFCIIAVIVAIAAMSYESFPSHFSEPHHWVGLLLLIAMTFQVMSGFLRPPVEKRDPYSSGQYDGADSGWFKLPRTPRDIWYMTHRVAGIVMLGMGIYQIDSGLHLFSEKFDVNIMTHLCLVYFGLFGAALLGLKLWIMFEEYKARQGMAAIHAVDGGAAGGVQESELQPAVQSYDAR